ncbi:2-hydroxyacid dehydrogenase [Paracoccus fistulariae]|uniref:Glyoxylate/hydroxypyruvate reductase A n=1 Tax=Paracoccus fistulariae TaxID=658446 RepID=A0ABY7SL64_9RHOB|nr:glyoxylate/hydroxypyruvate reductase A [Paracoccus fistulariae]MDB6182040.1 glyoxylate/hydroxypyruvate reductase A [Paracoccus fistulariae]WCR06726.1 glyoxylate/hydroxypyruvate reductase A [Paracoccus fistulariae]
MRVLFAAPGWDRWAPALQQAAPEMELLQDGDPAGFDAIIYAPGGEIEDLSPYVNARLVQSLWAGVERIVTNPTLTQPLARMVDPGLAQGMAEFCTGWAMRAHLGMDRYAQDGLWRGGLTPPLASDRNVTILGMGELGRAVAAMLRGIGFRVTGYSASGRPVEGVRVVAGDGLDQALSQAEILINLLPDTPDTRDILNARTLAQLPQGAWLINPGRGTVLEDAALLEALDRGHLGHAVLDVFRTEPLPAEHPFWTHPGVTVTPHIAAETRPETAAPVAVENIRRAMRGQPVLHLVDRTKGY